MRRSKDEKINWGRKEAGRIHRKKMVGDSMGMWREKKKEDTGSQEEKVIL